MAKRIIVFIIAGIYLSGCSRGVITHINPKIDMGLTDFTAYTREGFLLTPEWYPGRYDMVAEMTVAVYPEGNLQQMQRGINRVYDWAWSPISVNQALRSIVDSAKRMGANALVRLNIDPIHKGYAPAFSDSSGSVTVPGILVKGWAIRRLDI